MLASRPASEQNHGSMFPEVCLRRPSVLLAVLLLLFFSGTLQRSRALDAAALQAMVIVEGDEGRGSGFVLKMGNKTFLITNSHVVRGNRNVRFKSLRNVEMAAGSLEIADQVDAVRTEVSGVADVLEIEPNIEKIKIGDEVIVAGNSEGAGVVREIPGKVVGIGPDRIEVDAEFVPGNSGSPILLKSTGKVIGIATYVYVPRGRVGTKSPFSLNEVRRFGYRLDTVGKWVAPSGKDRLVQEGMKLVEMETLFKAITSVVESNANFVTKWGADTFVNKEQAKQYPALASLSLAIDDFVKAYKAAAAADDKSKAATAFFAKLKSIIDDDTRGLAQNQFSGFYATQLKQSLDRFKEFTDWYDGTAMPAYRDNWLTSQYAMFGRSNGPRIDPAKFKVTLSDRVAEGEAVDNCHHVEYPAAEEPANTDGLFWIIVDPNGAQRAIQMHHTSVRVRTPVPGTYRVYVEFRGDDKPKTVSNVVEVKYANAGLAVTKVDATASRVAYATIAANSPEAFTITDVRKGTKITLQYLKGVWKSWGRVATAQPDDPKAEGGDVCRLAIALPVRDGKVGEVLAMVPPNTRKEAFIFEAQQDYPVLVLRINSKDVSYSGNPGSVDYKLSIQPLGAAVPKEEAAPKEFAALGLGRTMLLGKESEARWQPTKGEWKLEKGVLTGTGDSITHCNVTVSPPFALEFKMKVLEGLRPRVKLGSLSFANEGYQPTLALYPPGRDAGMVTYQLKQNCNVSLLVRKKSVQLYIDRRLVSTGPALDKELKDLEFRAGDSWSKGKVEFRDISVIRTDNGLAPAVAGSEEVESRSAFTTAPGKDIDAALKLAETSKKRVLVFVLDPIQQHSFHLKATMSSPETRKLVDENFIVVFVSDSDAKYISGKVDDVSPVHPAWLLLRPDGTVVERGDAAMGADRGLKWIQHLVALPQ